MLRRRKLCGLWKSLNCDKITDIKSCKVMKRKPLLLTMMMMISSWCSSAPCANAGTTSVQIQPIIVSDCDGARQARVKPQQITELVQFSNKVYAAAQIRFEFKESDVVYLRSTTLNSMMGEEDGNWQAEVAEGNRVAAQYPTKIVVFFRFGPGSVATGQGFSSEHYNFVAMPGFDDARHCGHPHTDALAHEIGHYLGLFHTFSNVFYTAKDMSEFFERHGKTASCFDNDGLSDTAPDPLLRENECTRIGKIEIGGMQFILPRRNIMSYYDERDQLSPSQAAIALLTLQRRISNNMETPSNKSLQPVLQFQDLPRSALVGTTFVQKMEGFGPGWSCGDQLFVSSKSPGHALAFDFSVVENRVYNLVLWATHAPDFARISIQVDNAPQRIVDLYAPRVLPSGPIGLGSLRLSAGAHKLVIRVLDKNSKSIGFNIGLDSFGCH